MERTKLTEKEITKLLLDNEEVCSDESARFPSNDNDSDNNLILFNPNSECDISTDADTGSGDIILGSSFLKSRDDNEIRSTLSSTGAQGRISLKNIARENSGPTTQPVRISSISDCFSLFFTKNM